MKTEQEIIKSMERVKDNMGATFHQAMRQFEDEDYSECSETLFTIMANVNALEAAKRILED